MTPKELVVESEPGITLSVEEGTLTVTARSETMFDEGDIFHWIWGEDGSGILVNVETDELYFLEPVSFDAEGDEEEESLLISGEACTMTSELHGVVSETMGRPAYDRGELIHCQTWQSEQGRLYLLLLSQESGEGQAFERHPLSEEAISRV